jgi:oxygen-independent coproporphyrinogen-3 oxidase
VHNRKYWTHVPYLGLGPSAHSFDGRRRFWNARELPEWSRRVAAGEDPTAGEESIGPRERALESLMLGLRTREGVDLAALDEALGRDIRGRNGSRLARLAEEGLVVLEGTRLRPTAAGLAVADGLAAGLEV